MVKPVLEVELSKVSLDELTATQMITQTVGDNMGMLYYVKVLTSPNTALFLKIYKPPILTDVSPVKLQGVQQAKPEDPLKVF